jgi:hypothetical protein
MIKWCTLDELWAALLLCVHFVLCLGLVARARAAFDQCIDDEWQATAIRIQLVDSITLI